MTKTQNTNRHTRRASRANGGNASTGSNVVEMLNSTTTTVRDERGNKRGFLTVRKDANQERLDARARLLGSTSQRLAEAKDLYNGGDENVQKASAIVNEVGVALYQARVRNILSADDVSDLLGNQFGFKMKGDAKKTVPAGDKNASKTPAGNGEAIRKRIVRAVQAYEYVHENASNAFFEALPTAKVGKVLDGLPHPGENGQWVQPEDGDAISLWAAYDRLAEIKRDNATDAMPLAFNFRRIAMVNAELERDIKVSAELIAKTPGLADAYASLMNTLNAIDEIGGEQQAA